MVSTFFSRISSVKVRRNFEPKVKIPVIINNSNV